MAPKRHRLLKVLVLSGGLGTLALVALVGLVFLMVLGLITDPLSGSSAGYDAEGFGAVPVISKGIKPADAQEEFAGELVACMRGMDPYVALGWTVAEGGGLHPDQPANNFLFLSAVGGGWRTFAVPADAAQAVCLTLESSLYLGVAAAMGQAPILQLLAIAQSPWDGGNVSWGDPAGHYGGDGRNLLSAYYAVLGSAKCQPAMPC